MDLNEFRQDLLSQTAAWAAADFNFSHSAFVEVAIRYLEEAGEVADFEPCYYRGTGTRRRALAIDGYAFDEADGSMRLFLADATLGTEPTTLTQTDARSLFGRLRAFVEDAAENHLQADLDPSSAAAGVATELSHRLRHLTKIRAYLLTDAILSSRAKDWPEGEISGIPVEFHIWDISRFHRVYTSRSGQDELVIDFGKVAGGGLPCIEAGTDSREYSAYLCVVPGTVLAEIYDEYGSRLLEGNVRSFLSTKGRINKGIRNTVLHQPEMFFAYNNGIAATASSISVARTLDGLKLVSATDLQIVNGGQTTASLAAARRSEKVPLDRTFVPMKLSVVSAEKSGEMIPLISRFANSQNKVNDADFFSNHDYHRRLEQISRRLWAPAQAGAQHETHWFYERTRGQYLNEPAAFNAADKKRFAEMNPRHQVITKTDLAKSENAWRQLPHIVSRGAQKNFVEFATHITGKWEENSEHFHEAYFRAIVARVILFKAIERLVSAQPWYSGGYRAQTVAYTLAKLSHVLETQKPRWQLDTRSIWQRQGISDGLNAQVRVIARSMYDVIMDPPAGIQNIGEWCKKDRCWERAVQADVPVLRELESDLTEVESVRAEERAAKSQQRQDTGISAQVAVVMLGPEYWSGLRSWAEERKLLSPDNDRLVRIAARLTPGLPNDRQSLRLLQLKAHMEAEGFAPVPVPT
jgi:hypothetical protein